MGAMASQITNLLIVYTTVIQSQIKKIKSASLAFVWGIHLWPMKSPYKGPVTRKIFPFGYVIMDPNKVTAIFSPNMLQSNHLFE